VYRILIAALVLGLVAACASNSDGLSKRPGYQEVQISELRYRVAYRGDGNDLPETIDRTLFRAAEVTASQGYDWFDIIDLQAGYITARGTFWPEGGYGRDSVIRRECILTVCRKPLYEVRQETGATSRERLDRTYTVIEVRIGKGIKPASYDAYDAGQVIETLKY